MLIIYNNNNNSTHSHKIVSACFVDMKIKIGNTAFDLLDFKKS